MANDKNIITSFQIENVKGFLSELNLLKFGKGRNSIPILDCVLIETATGKITITSTDLDTTLICDIPATANGEAAFCVNLVSLIDAVKKAKHKIIVTVSETLTESLEKEVGDDGKVEQVKVAHKGIQAQLQADDAATFTLDGTDAEQFPDIAPGKDEKYLYTIGGGSMSELIKKTIFSATNEQSRFTLSAIALELGKTGLRAIACDGHRLAIADTKDFKQAKLQENRLLNLGGAKVLQKIIDGKVTIATDENHLIFKTLYGNRTLIARKPSGTFPNYAMVLPKEIAYTFGFHAKEVLPVVQSALSYSDERTKSIAFQPYYNNFVIKSGGGDKAFTGKATCDFPQNSAPGVQCNAQYLIDACTNGDNQILKLGYKDTSQQFQITGENDNCKFTFVVMPLALGHSGVAAFQVLTDDEKPNFPLVPFYKDFDAKPRAAAKPNNKQTIADLHELLSDIESIANVKGLPELFAEICLDTIEQAREKLNLLK